LDPGSELAGRYVLRERLGQGAVGEVWRATDRVLDRAVAIKLVREKIDDPELARFQREARLAAGLQHPGITVVHDVSEADGQPFIVMELLDGSDLAALLDQAKTGLPLDQVMSLGVQAAQALQAAHEGHIIHRDLKPANLFVLSNGRLKVCDFGIAVATDAADSIAAGSYILGTPAYMSPEQCDGEPADKRSDLYALGCVLYAMLTGHPPFPLGPPLTIMSQHRKTPPPALSSARRQVPAELDLVVMSLLAKNPASRPATAGDVATALASIQQRGQTGSRSALTASPGPGPYLPPAGTGPAAGPPGAWAAPSSQAPPSAYLTPGAISPGGIPPGAMPPGGMLPSGIPPNQAPPGAYLPPGAMPPGGMPAAPRVPPIPESGSARLTGGVYTVGSAASNWLSQLREADRANALRLDRASQRSSTRNSRALQRAQQLQALNAIAARDFARLSNVLWDAITRAAPTADAWQSELGWTVRLGYATLECDALRAQPPNPYGSGMWAPFDIIAYSSVSLHFHRPHQRYQGRSHSLWYCDAQAAGRYHWYETAFMTGSLRAMTISRCPYALQPPHAARAFIAGPLNVAWPFTALVGSNLNEFIGRWATWLATAAQGTLTRPSQFPDRDPRGSWRWR
jgi:tRNA A-37 threonylcarbamoyl transferase component Bud32